MLTELVFSLLFAALRPLFARVYRLFQSYAPSNVIIRRARTRAAITRGPLIGLAGAAVCAGITVVSVILLGHDAPEWIFIITVIAFWDTLKFLLLILTATVRLLRARHHERVSERDRLKAARGTAPNA